MATQFMTNVDPNVIDECINENKVLRITYQDRKGVTTKRAVEPYEIKNGKLYAYCLVKGGIRAFNLDNLITCEDVGTHFTPRY